MRMCSPSMLHCLSSIDIITLALLLMHWEVIQRHLQHVSSIVPRLSVHVGLGIRLACKVIGSY